MSSSSNSDTTVELALKPSTRALAMLLVLHGVALLLTMAAMPQGAAQIVALALIAVSWLYVRRHRLFGFGRGALHGILWNADGGWRLTTAAGESLDAELDPASVVRGRWLLLRFRLASGARLSRAILGDEAPEEALRRLRARLAAQPE